MQEIKHMLEVLFAKTDIVTIESLLDYIQNKGLQDEKEQIIEASKNGISHGYTEGVVFGTNPRDYIVKWSEQYYNKTYNQNES